VAYPGAITPTQVITYLYDGLDIIGAQLAVSGTVTETYYYLAPSPVSSLRRPLEMERLPILGSGFAGDRHWYQSDGLDSVVALTDESGALSDALLYEEYGQQLVGMSDLQIFAYTGQDYDVETELYHFYARYYDSDKGIWTKPDPYRYPVNSEFVFGSYGYVEQNPVNFRDLLGFRPESNDSTSIRSQWDGQPVIIIIIIEIDIIVAEQEQKCCGPDVTNWLVNQMNTNLNHPTVTTMRDNQWALYIPIFNLGWIAAALQDFKSLVQTGGPWDFKNLPDYSSATSPGNGTGCPSEGCERTVTLCGMCFDYDVPGNIHYGWIGRAIGWRDWLLHFGADLAQDGGTDDPKDKAAIDIGEELMDNGGNLCSLLIRDRNLLRQGPSDCEPCTDVVYQ
jgi:RHS repeat-associated protein